MNDVRHLFLPLALLLGLLCGGCYDDGEEAIEFEPGTPREAIVEFNNGIRDLDKAKARSWVMPGDLQTEFFEVTYGMSEMVSRFKKRFVEVYGQESMKLLQSQPGAQLDYMDTHADAARLNSMIVEPMGDVAYASFPDEQRMRVVRLQGKWLVDAVGTDDPAVLDEVRAILGPQMVLAQILNEATPLIGKDGMSAEEFDLRLGRLIVNTFQNLEREAQAVAVPSFEGGAGAEAQQPPMTKEPQGAPDGDAANKEP